MIEIDKDTENSVKSPFQEEVVVENYFACANRGEVLSQIKEAVQNGATLMVLTGEEGSGKTMICRLLEHQLSPICTTVFLPRTVDSFEEAVQIIARELGLIDVAELEGGDIELTLEQINDFLLEESINLFIIFDEAENLFLATLERIRKMLDRAIGAGVQMHILFSGRETLLENCNQLALNDFQDTDDLFFELMPLSKDETADYLKHCSTRLTDKDVTTVFSDEDVSNIYSLAKGNFRTINILGTESVKSHSADTSFMVLLDGVKDGYGSERGGGYAAKYSPLVDKFRPYFPWIGGGLCCFLLFLFLVGLGDEDSDVAQDIQQTQKNVEIETVTTVREPLGKNIEIAEPVEKVQSPEENETAFQVSEQNAPVDEEAVSLPVENTKQKDVEQQQSVLKHAATMENEIAEKVEVIEDEVVVEAGDQVLVETKDQQHIEEAEILEAADIVTLRPRQELKIKHASSPEHQGAIIKVQSRKEVRSGTVANGYFSVADLYDARLMAGLSWKGSDKENMYTVQLMVLASSAAEKNLKKMLAQVNYRQEAGNFFIFEKATKPANIYVFYGEYPNIETARLVKNSLPKFLRDHKPYVVSIKGAISKVRK